MKECALFSKGYMRPIKKLLLILVSASFAIKITLTSVADDALIKSVKDEIELYDFSFSEMLKEHFMVVDNSPEDPSSIQFVAKIKVFLPDSPEFAAGLTKFKEICQATGSDCEPNEK